MSNAERIAAWLSSPEGQKSVSRAQQIADTVVSQLQTSRFVTDEILRRPFGPADGGRVWPHQRGCLA